MQLHPAPVPKPLSRARFFPAFRALAATLLFLGASGAATLRADQLFVTCSTNQIEKIAANGSGAQFANTGSSSQPEGLAFDSAGNLFEANFNFNVDNIVRYTPAGVGTTFATNTTGVSRPIGLAFDSAGSLYVSNTGNNSIVKFNITTGVSTPFVSTGLSGPGALAFDRAGNLYVSNQGTNSVIKITPGGVTSTYTAITASANSIAGIAFDRSGNLFVSDVNANKIFQFSSVGVLSTFATSGLNQPIGMAFDTVGNLYVANQGNASVTRFTSGGANSIFANTFAAPQYLAFTDDAGKPLPLPIPEPSTWLAILALSGAGLLARRRP